MSYAGPRALFLFVAFGLALLAAYVLYRTTVQAAVGLPEKTEFDLATTASVGAVVATEELNPADEFVAVPEAYPPAAPEAEREDAEPG